MKTINFLYKNDTDFEMYLNENNFSLDSYYFIQIHTSFLTSVESIDIAKKIKSILPNSVITGVSVSGVIHNGNNYDDEVLLSISCFENTNFISKIISINDIETEGIANQVIELSKTYESSVGIMLIASQNKNFTDIISVINEADRTFSLVGGVAGYIKEDGEVVSYLFDENDFYTNSILITFIEKKYLLSKNYFISGQPTISKKYSITKVEEGNILEVDGEKITEWITKNLNFPNSNDFFFNSVDFKQDSILKFSLKLNSDNSSRFLKYDPVTGANTFHFTKCTEGDNFVITYPSTLKNYEEWLKASHDLKKYSTEYVLMYSCVFRKLLLKNLTNWEAKIFENNNATGAFLLGNISTKNDKIEYSNTSCSFITLAESENYIKLNNSVLSDYSFLNGDTLLNYVKSVKANEILNRLIKEEELIKKTQEFYFSKNSLKSVIDYIKEQDINTNSRVCFIKIHFSEQFLKEQTDNETILYENYKILLMNYIKRKFRYINITFYSFSENKFFVTINIQASEEVIKENFRNISSEFESELNINKDDVNFKFAVTFKGLNIYKISQEIDLSEKPILFINDEEKNENHIQTEFEVVESIKEIILSKRVEPYFQGIYDNKNNNIYAYECLMRFTDKSGNVLLPSDFMGISKKYNLHTSLSIIHIEKIFNIFSKRNEIIAFDVTVENINSKIFTDAFFDKLSKVPNPSNFIVELTDTNRFDEAQKIKDFVDKVREYKVLVAIDDFGTGFSSFAELEQIHFDIIKIDGSLTKLFGTNANYDETFEVLSEFGKKNNVKLIANQVETTKMQKILISKGVQYSQGYLFSKPMSIQELFMFSLENEYMSEQANMNNEIEENTKRVLKTLNKKHNKLLFYSILALIIVIFVSIILYLAFRFNDDRASIIFELIIIILFTTTIILINIINSRNKKTLIEALKLSHYLTNSLQTSMETDYLTRTYSRLAITEKITETISTLGENSVTCFLLVLDLDNFKYLNDTFGHAVGDHYLQNFVRAVKTNLRQGDLIGRTGGDEFVVLLKSIDETETVKLINAIIDSVTKIKIKNVDLSKSGVSIGFVCAPLEGNEYNILFEKADKALYHAKKNAKHSYFKYDVDLM